MSEPGSPTVRRLKLAAWLREIRENRGESGETVAAAVNWSPSKISRYERAKTGMPPREVQKLIDYYEVPEPERSQILQLANEAAQRGWWEDFSDILSDDYRQFIGLEHEASSIAIWHVSVIPGLLQTEEYARNIISSYSRVEPIAPGIITRLVRVRMRRQQVLERDGLELSIVLDESILRRRIGNEKLMYDQLQYLAREADRQNVTLQVFPLDAQHTVLGESFVIFGFGAEPETMLRDVVSAEHLRSGYNLESERETYLHRLALKMLADESLDPASSKALILETAESLWSGASRPAHA